MATIDQGERRRLAERILNALEPGEEPEDGREEARQPRVHLADLIKTLPPGPRCFPTWEEYESALQQEKDSWDR